MLKKNRNIILSTVGTSLLTNKTSVKEERELLSKYSNCKENECPNELINLVDRLYPIALEDLKSFDNTSKREFITTVYNKCEKNISRTSKSLKCSLNTVRKYLKGII